jgi:hypothetical protein
MCHRPAVAQDDKKSVGSGLRPAGSTGHQCPRGGFGHDLDVESRILDDERARVGSAETCGREIAGPERGRAFRPVGEFVPAEIARAPEVEAPRRAVAPPIVPVPPMTALLATVTALIAADWSPLMRSVPAVTVVVPVYVLTPSNRQVLAASIFSRLMMPLVESLSAITPLMVLIPA